MRVVARAERRLATGEMRALQSSELFTPVPCELLPAPCRCQAGPRAGATSRSGGADHPGHGGCRGHRRPFPDTGDVLRAALRGWFAVTETSRWRLARMRRARIVCERGRRVPQLCHALALTAFLPLIPGCHSRSCGRGGLPSIPVRCSPAQLFSTSRRCPQGRSAHLGVCG